MTTPDQPMPGSTADHCSAFPDEPHHIETFMGRSELYVRRCSLCGWIDFGDLQRQAEALRAEGRRQATDGWEREWAVDLGGRWPMHPCDSEADARRLAAYRDGRTVVSRLVGPWEPAEQDGSPDSPAAKMRSLRAHPHGSACICDDCTARDEAEQAGWGDRG